MSRTIDTSSSRSRVGPSRRWFVSIGAALLSVASIVLVTSGADGSSAQAAGNGDKVTICHATSSSSNPYTSNTVDTSSIDEQNNRNLNGHGDHSGDIIPSFVSPSGSIFPGQNLGSGGAAILANGCEAPTPTTTTTLPPPPPPVWTPPVYPPFQPEECMEYQLKKATSTWSANGNGWSAWTDWPSADPRAWGDYSGSLTGHHGGTHKGDGDRAFAYVIVDSRPDTSGECSQPQPPDDFDERTVTDGCETGDETVTVTTYRQDFTYVLDESDSGWNRIEAGDEYSVGESDRPLNEGEQAECMPSRDPNVVTDDVGEPKCGDTTIETAMTTTTWSYAYVDGKWVEAVASSLSPGSRELDREDRSPCPPGITLPPPPEPPAPPTPPVTPASDLIPAQVEPPTTPAPVEPETTTTTTVVPPTEVASETPPTAPEPGSAPPAPATTSLPATGGPALPISAAALGSLLAGLVLLRTARRRPEDGETIIA